MLISVSISSQFSSDSILYSCFHIDPDGNASGCCSGKLNSAKVPCKAQNVNQGLEMIIRQSATKLGAPLPSEGTPVNALLRLLWNRGGFQDLKSSVLPSTSTQEKGFALEFTVFLVAPTPPVPEDSPCWDKLPAGCQWLKEHSSHAAFFELLCWCRKPNPEHLMRCSRCILHLVCHGWAIQISVPGNRVMRPETSPAPSPERSRSPSLDSES